MSKLTAHEEARGTLWDHTSGTKTVPISKLINLRTCLVYGMAYPPEVSPAEYPPSEVINQIDAILRDTVVSFTLEKNAEKASA